MEKKAKQILIWRNDLRNTKGEKVRSGKITSQLAHASWATVLNSKHCHHDKEAKTITISYGDNPALEEWFVNRFTKVSLKANNLEDLQKLFDKAQAAGLMCSLITDAGFTEFDGPTVTCIGIGPAYPEELDSITGHLSTL